MGCRVKKSPKNKAGKTNLAFRLIFRGPAGEEIRSWEGTKLEATAQNEKIMRARAVLIEDEIRRGEFNYLKHFPQGNKASLFNQYRAATEPKTIRQYYQSWKKDKIAPFVKKKRARMYASHFDVHILPVDGDKYMHLYSVADIRALRSVIVEKKKLTMKTARNVIDATLRAMFRDAKAEGVVDKTPFDDVPKRWWPRNTKPPPNPFTEKERDELVKYFKKKYSPHWPHGHALLVCLFWTGWRPSELTARRWRDYDPRTGKMAINSSRVDGEEGTTKTRASERTKELLGPAREAINRIRPLRAKPDDYIFVNQAGRPIDQKEFAWRHFWPALTVLKLGHRDFYATRDTFISVMLSHGEPAKSVAEYCGTSVYMIEESYGKYIGGSHSFGAAALAAATVKKPPDSPQSEKTGEKSQDAETNTQTFPQVRLVRGAGFEP